jgi:hypothetical protein
MVGGALLVFDGDPRFASQITEPKRWCFLLLRLDTPLLASGNSAGGLLNMHKLISEAISLAHHYFKPNCGSGHCRE